MPLKISGCGLQAVVDVDGVDPAVTQLQTGL
jgi:hypothetical protein